MSRMKPKLEQKAKREDTDGLLEVNDIGLIGIFKDVKE